VEFKNKVHISYYREINQINHFEWNSNFWSSFDRNWCFLAIRCIKEHVGQISSKSKVPSFSSEFSSEFQLIEVLWVLVQIPFRIWRSFYSESCSLSQPLSIHILFGIFWAIEVHPLVKTIRGHLNLVWIIRNHHCSSRLGPLHNFSRSEHARPCPDPPSLSRCQPRTQSGCRPPVGARPHSRIAPWDPCGSWVWPNGEPEVWEETWEPPLWAATKDFAS
jgi:hypothetical protein